jgi:hypothetical protein
MRECNTLSAKELRLRVRQLNILIDQCESQLRHERATLRVFRQELRKTKARLERLTRK